MRTFAKIQIIVHNPIAEDRKKELARKTAEIHADAISKYLQGNLSSTEQKLKMIQVLTDLPLDASRRLSR